MGRINGITITLIDKVKIGRDDFGHSVFDKREIEVKNVLVTPTSTDDRVNQLNLTGKVADYTLAIPKGDTHNWIDREVHFFDQRWRTIGIPIEGIESLIPLDWNKKVMVELYE
nr:MAG TPA: Minor capsid protein [Bacteriophage sp.]